MPRFVVLTHSMPPDAQRPTHWDLMLEEGPALRTRRLESPPGEGPPIDSLALADHRIDYLSYEGPISGGRGDVQRWDAGQFAVAAECAGELVVDLQGSRLHGRATLQRDDVEPQRWRFSFVAASNST